MAATVTPAALAEGVVVGGGTTGIFGPVPADEIWIVHSLYIKNADTAPHTLTLDTTSGPLYQDVPIDSGDTWTLEAGQIIVVQASNSLNFSSDGAGALVASCYGAKHVTT